MRTKAKKCYRAMREVNAVGRFLLAIAGIVGSMWVVRALFTLSSMDVVRDHVCIPIMYTFGQKSETPCSDLVCIALLGLILYSAIFVFAMFAEFQLNSNLPTFVRTRGPPTHLEWLDFEGQSYFILCDIGHSNTGMSEYLAYRKTDLIRSCIAWFVGSICAIVVMLMGWHMMLVVLAQFIMQPLVSLATRTVSRRGPLVHLAVICAAHACIYIAYLTCCLVGGNITPLIIKQQEGDSPCVLGYVSILVGFAIAILDMVLCGVYFVLYIACAGGEIQEFTIAGTFSCEDDAREQISSSFIVYDCERVDPDRMLASSWRAHALHRLAIVRYVCEWVLAHVVVVLVRAFASQSILLSIFVQLAMPALCDGIFIMVRTCGHWLR